MSDAYILFVAERNSGRESGYLALHLRQNFKKVMLIKQKEDKDYGWWTAHDGKKEYAYTARYNIVTQNIALLQDYVCQNSWISPEKRRDECTKKFYTQMGRYRLVSSKPNTAFGTGKVTVSGKTNEQGKISDGFNDDLFFVFTWCCSMLDKLYHQTIPNLNYGELFQ
jgi:hypothetical protein